MTGTAPAKKGRVLLLCHRIPYPPDKGDKIRAYQLLKFLAARFDVSLGCFIDDPEDLVHRKTLDALCQATHYVQVSPKLARLKSLGGLMRREPLSFAFYNDRTMTKWVAQQRTQTLAAEIAFSSAMAPYLKGASAPTIVDMVDADSAKFASYSLQGNMVSRAVYGREGKSLAKAEVDIVNSTYRTFLVTPEEASIVRQLPGIAEDRVDWYRNGVDLRYWRSDARFERISPGFDVVFTGAMDYRPNIDAVLRFANEMWPLLLEQSPNLRFGIVGSKPSQAVQALAERPGIHVTGRVADMRPYLAAAKVAVAPLQIARGIQNKVLEAMAMGVPVVASTGALTGTGAIPDEHAMVADTPRETVLAIVKLLEDPQQALALGCAAQDFIRREFPWEATMTRFAAVMDAVSRDNIAKLV